MIPRAICPFVMGFFSGQVLANLVSVNPSVWFNMVEGGVAIWASISLWLHQSRRDKAINDIIERHRITGQVRAEDLASIDQRRA